MTQRSYTVDTLLKLFFQNYFFPDMLWTLKLKSNAKHLQCIDRKYTKKNSEDKIYMYINNVLSLLSLGQNKKYMETIYNSKDISDTRTEMNA